MPEFEKIGNDGKPTGVKQTFTFTEAAKLRRIKNSRWKEIPGDKPKISRTNPIEATDKNLELVKNFPSKMGDQLKWVKRIENKPENLELLEAAKQLAEEQTVINAIDSKIRELKGEEDSGSDK